MSRQDFELIARTIRDLPEAPEVRERVAKEFARALGWSHPRFNTDRFLTACGVK